MRPHYLKGTTMKKIKFELSNIAGLALLIVAPNKFFQA